ncbi:putative NAD(P)H--quinone oxidoreductase [Gordonia effusa NBRC 100432]|uniref:Putative NAD(P)H--quinone oxidoreductase n=1 Tax=Gordonia effusa NBRC 100432 TaxID=1077974 RepID=H0R106_9ACTN|nr:NmrA family NAD(P)-binding protein [Gordonia effusa]GAB18757.1 putative NAD(P)H--quinone oxidoreductase [Gordonia effusa NBRC 100432]
MTTYAVTGATGGLGGAAIDALLASGVEATDIVAVVRDSAKAASLADRGVQVRQADYSDVRALTTALSGVDKLLFVSGSEVGQRAAQHANVIAAAKSAQVSFTAYTSLLRATDSALALGDEHRATEKALAESGLAYSLLRNGWYWENYLAATDAAIESGTLYGAAGDGRVAGASRADYARAAAAVLVSDSPRAVYELAGDQPLTYADIAAQISTASGKPVVYQNLSQADYAAALAGNGLPEPVANILADADAGVATGQLDSTSTDLVDLIGRPSTPFNEVLRAAQ